MFLHLLPCKAGKVESITRQLEWNGIQTNQFSANETHRFLTFKKCSFNAKQQLPEFFETFPLPNGVLVSNLQFAEMTYQPLTADELGVVHLNEANSGTPLHWSIETVRKVPMVAVRFFPFRKNPATGQLEKVISFHLNFEFQPDQHSLNPTSNHAPIASLHLPGAGSNQPSHSVLANGSWIKIAVLQNGVYLINADFIKNLGFNLSSINPDNIQIFGNGGGQLPYANASYRKFDLTENPVYLHKVISDGQFDPGDYILFYGKDQTKWTYNPTTCPHFQHQLNAFSDTTYYFMHVGNSSSKKISGYNAPAGSPSTVVSSFDDYIHSETNQGNTVNLIQSGQHWYGFHFNTSQTFNFPVTVPYLDNTSNAQVKVDLIGRYSTTSTYQVTSCGQSSTISPSPVNTNLYYSDYASPASTCFTLSTPNPQMDVTVNQLTSGADAWLNFIELNFRRNLVMNGNQMEFRDSKSIGVGKVAQFSLSSHIPVQVWDITDPTNATSVPLTVTGGNYLFNAACDSLRQFIAFGNNGFLSPIPIGPVPNQNLHGLPQADLLIITHPNFYQASVSLGNFHKNHDNLSTVVATTKQIYNEFSSGAPDISAIRDFIKMFYDRSTSYNDLPKYVLLMGTGSYDNLYRIPNNTNFIPTYESDNSHTPTDSYVSDDFYGLLDYNEGYWTDTSSSLIDIGIGRIPVTTAAEAQNVVNKVMTYVGKGGDWRNIICFTADTYSPDCNIHESQADAEANLEQALFPVNNVDKIYLDAFPVVGTPGGDRYPAAETAINNRVNSGALIMNYTGHGGTLGWSHDRVLGTNDIVSWNNLHALPLFVTATCDFSTYDNPAVVSAGEDILLNPGGGGVALFSTVRLVFSSPNFTLNQYFYDSLYSRLPTGELPRIGDLIRMTKVAAGPGVNNRNFTLLGDPALRLAYPNYNVVTDSINGNKLNVNVIHDTLKALSIAHVSGHLTDHYGNLLPQFNGVIYPTVFDKPTTAQTLGNGGGCVTPFSFSLQKNILYKGLATVKNGKFNFSFVVPKDINYQFGAGKISYYADNDVTDANGYSKQFIIGGSSPHPLVDKLGPGIKLYMNAPGFAYGGETNENPVFYAILRDSSGINTVGNGIGHDLVAVLDGNTSNPIVMNDYYQADINSYKSGVVRYPFAGLSPGRHLLTFKAWDVCNNSSQASLEFVVATASHLTLNHVLNYPNPFTTHTTFFFEYNRCCEPLEVQIQILTITGKLVKILHTTMVTDGFRSNGMDWDGKDDFGHNIGRGVYVYHLKIKTADGSFAEKTEKLVLLF